MALSARVQMQRRSHAEGMAHLVRQRERGAEVDTPACTEWLPLGDLETERAHGTRASGAAAHGTHASMRVAVGAVSGSHPESHNSALDARGVGDAALLQGVVGVA